MKQTNVRHTVDVMEMVIGALESDFGVSRQVVKIRLVELGFEEAIGTFNYVDGHYVKPHGFRKGSIKINQTFTLSAQDAAIQRFANLELREKTASGDYLFVDNHYVYNAPLYVGLILSILVDTFFTRISMPKQYCLEIHNISAA